MEATYGVTGMMEWIALIPSGRNIVRVRFSGGSLTGFGVTPATFKTRNPVVMRMIEGSHYYQSGKIRLISKRGEESADEPRETHQPTIGGGHDSQSSSGQYVTFSKEKR